MKKLFFLIASVGLLSACSVTQPFAVTNNSLGSKTGTSSNTCLFGVPVGGSISSGGICFNTKSYGIKEAAKDGGIDKVGSVDIKVSNYIILKKYELIVRGE